MSRAAQQRAAIRRLTEALTAPLPTADVHQIVVEEAHRLTDAASAALCLLADDREMLDFVAAAGENAAEIVGLRIRVADSLSASIVSTGQPALLDAGSSDATGDLFAPSSEAASKSAAKPSGSAAPAGAEPPASLSTESLAGARSAAIVPVFQDGRLIGTLSALNKIADASGGPAAFDAEDLDTLVCLAEMVALARKVQTTAQTAREQARELAVLYDAARTVAGSLNVQEVMDSVLNAICTHLEHHTAILFLLNDERTHLFIAAERGLTETEREIQLSVESGIPARVLSSGQPRLVADTDIEPEFEDISERARALSAMIAPIRSHDETHGLILVTSLQRQAYRSDDLKLLAAVGMQAGIAIENAWLYEDAQRQAEEATALYDLSQHVNATLHLDRVLNFVADSVLNLLKVDKFALMLYDSREDRLVTRLSRHVDEEVFGAIRPRVGEGIAGWVYEWQTPQAVSDVAADARNRSAPIDVAGVASTLCVPMHVGEDVIGVIHAMSSKRRLFTVAEMELLYTIANQAAVAIVNAMLYQDARSKSTEMRRYFRRIAHAIGSALDEQDMPQLLADLAVEIMRADRCAIYRVEGEELRLQATSHFRPTVPPDVIVPLGAGLSGWVARRGQSLLLTNLEEDPRSRAHTWLSRDKLTSYLAVPLKSDRRTVGVVEIYTQEPREFSKEEVQLLATFARRARVADKMAIGEV
ncbi:MAG TPA: GAF domain-containing protein [Chthonomonadaceae bacterium]|nr:GAF domain-containing protein [Chthonomonadaceae bacterium]